jgi:hypothetical protein
MLHCSVACLGKDLTLGISNDEDSLAPSQHAWIRNALLNLAAYAVRYNLTDLHNSLCELMTSDAVTDLRLQGVAGLAPATCGDRPCPQPVKNLRIVHPDP